VFTVLLNVVCNLCRIILLVLFKIPPGNIFHDLTGLICLFVYVILPLIWLSGRYLKRAVKVEKHPRQHQLTRFAPYQLRYPVIHVFFAVALLIIAFSLKSMDKLNANTIVNTMLPSYNKTVLESGVIKFEKPGSLVYLKSTAFYGPEHSPMICWRGSGYEFKTIRKQVIAGHEVYAGTLSKGNDTIYTAWWFENGNLKTISQLQWRWTAAKGAPPFCLVNVNATSESGLIKAIKELPEIK